MGGTVASYTPDEQRNIDTVNRMFTEPVDLVGLFADDATWWNGLPLVPANPGQTEHKGIDGIRKLLGTMGAEKPGPGMDLKDPSTIRYSDVVLVADGDYVVRQHTEHATTFRGNPYRNVYCYVFRFDNAGKIKYLTEHWNTWYAYRVLFNNFEWEPAHPDG